MKKTLNIIGAITITPLIIVTRIISWPIRNTNIGKNIRNNVYIKKVIE